MTGTDSQGQPVRVTAPLRLPSNPRAIPQTRPASRASTQQMPSVSSASTVAVTIPIQSINNRSLVYAFVNNRERVLLLLDTGASRTILNPDVASALGLRITAETPRRKLRVFRGQEIDVPFVQLAALAVKDAVVKELEVGIYQGHPQVPLIDGVLGNDFLNHFTVTIDRTASRLQLKSRETISPHQEPPIRPISGQRFTDHAKKFSAEKPPMAWDVTTQYPNAVTAWRNRDTKSQIHIFVNPPANLSYRSLSKMFLSNLEIVLQERRLANKIKIELVEEKSMFINGKRFYLIITDLHTSLLKGTQEHGKLLLYLYKAHEFDYVISFITTTKFFERDRPVLEEMVQSFTYLSREQSRSVRSAHRSRTPQDVLCDLVSRTSNPSGP
ncbi:hypothetical protein C2W62_24270 [Candidatus Entotheonella serta]|nr:hypothetical protein C2W62_24270 [Candidatus Entotheonella serta]